MVAHRNQLHLQITSSVSTLSSELLTSCSTAVGKVESAVNFTIIGQIKSRFNFIVVVPGVFSVRVVSVGLVNI